jgi:polygalacturonase
MAKYNVLDFNVIGDGKTKNTQAIADVIAACQAGGGGTVYFPAGTYLTGAVHLRSNMTLYLEAGAKLLFSTDFDDYPMVLTRWSGYQCYGYSPLIYGIDLFNVSIKGEGIIDGQGHVWWEAYNGAKAGRAAADGKREAVCGEK